MIQKNTKIKPVDNSGVVKANVFHVYKNLNRIAVTGNFLKISVRELKPESLIKKKSKHISILVKTKYKNKKLDGSFIKFKNNGLVILKKRLTPKGSNLKGVVSRNVRRKKFISSFPKNI
jgi:large subunit ribosomal protein L14